MRANSLNNKYRATHFPLLRPSVAIIFGIFHPATQTSLAQDSKRVFNDKITVETKTCSIILWFDSNLCLLLEFRLYRNRFYKWMTLVSFFCTHDHSKCIFGFSLNWIWNVSKYFLHLSSRSRLWIRYNKKKWKFFGRTHWA